MKGLSRLLWGENKTPALTAMGLSWVQTQDSRYGTLGKIFSDFKMEKCRLSPCLILRLFPSTHFYSFTSFPIHKSYCQALPVLSLLSRSFDPFFCPTFPFLPPFRFCPYLPLRFCAIPPLSSCCHSSIPYPSSVAPSHSPFFLFLPSCPVLFGGTRPNPVPTLNSQRAPDKL